MNTSAPAAAVSKAPSRSSIQAIRSELKSFVKAYVRKNGGNERISRKTGAAGIHFSPNLVT
jgi:hypothetical protein